MGVYLAEIDVLGLGVDFDRYACCRLVAGERDRVTRVHVRRCVQPVMGVCRPLFATHPTLGLGIGVLEMLQLRDCVLERAGGSAVRPTAALIIARLVWIAFLSEPRKQITYVDSHEDRRVITIAYAGKKVSGADPCHRRPRPHRRDH
jgi:hypothetical protein